MKVSYLIDTDESNAKIENVNLFATSSSFDIWREETCNFNRLECESLDLSYEDVFLFLSFPVN